MNKLLNLDEPIPNEFFVFINFDSLLTKHNLESTNSIFSAAFTYISIRKDLLEKYINGTLIYLPFAPNSKKDLGIISPFVQNITSGYKTEYNAELCRFQNFPLFPSRLSALYAFGDFQTCEKVSKLHKWPIETVRKFKLVPSVNNRIIKVNMEIVSLERYANKISTSSPETVDLTWKSYWTGKGEIETELPTINGRKTFKSGVIWEYLIEGVLELSS